MTDLHDAQMEALQERDRRNQELHDEKNEDDYEDSDGQDEDGEGKDAKQAHRVTSEVLLPSSQSAHDAVGFSQGSGSGFGGNAGESQETALTDMDDDTFPLPRMIMSSDEEDI